MQDYRERRNDLGQTFGTKKAKKAIASVTENAIDQRRLFRDPSKASKPEKLSAANLAMLGAIAETASNVKTKEEMANVIDEHKPKADHATNDPVKAFTADNVVGLDTMKLIPIRQWVENIKAKKDIRTTSRFVSRRVRDQANNHEKLKLLRYMLLLIEFYNATTPGKFGRSLPRREDLKRILGDMPEAVLEGVKRKFTVAGMMSRQKSDSLIMHVCALAFMIEVDVDTWDLKEDLKLEPKPMQTYFTEIGAKIWNLGEVERKKLGLEKAAAAQHKVARLKMPVEYPKLRKGPKQRY